MAAELQPTGVVKVFEGGRVGTLGGTPEAPGSTHGVNVAREHVFFSAYGAYAPAGQYDIWVTSYRSGENIRGTLNITELRSNHP